MFNPGMAGISRQQMEQAQEVGRHMGMEITKRRKEGRLEVRFYLLDPNEKLDLGEPVDKLCEQLAWGFSTMFGIKGKIINVE
ncbi:hypothetical protein DEALK_06970 [Dehalogenimonas alkenigignens]|uniref:Uncharacterized protein n=1 Tax=Dehalogenimonas alkenigignens TaxID=1217799 RepID=A0A0W0GH34_9CHLR|nr:hypothetical protein [Dehalogenimonas alkenigignens]KTB47852.1 hypothetical protein DEALK_06970 [Dehalogenimonas alkenigignens]